ncbi:DUF418 domain-containing protein [Salegentibacter sp. F188]|uniref:DUF418 domain-containing protein n=1 Tax=Autumnicola patrickiae TaxID=3075591 RepID=A0ABU3E2J9_9FLAO|nr:DUF418 domain-containing protein [Salegentibacter sp. F188]MDT0689909.1 DUF418 domain-containing protein [Salegentibacter sp. F188]
MGESTITKSKDRIDTVDVLRGFALAGILYAHMIIWYTGAALPAEVYSKYNSKPDGIAMGIFGALVFGKFFSVFSFLFGLSFYLHFRKNKSKSGYLKVYSWRLFLLFLIGIVHHIVWRGDILAIYAILGMILLFFRNLPPKLLLVLSLLLIINLPTHIFELFLTEQTNADVSLPMEEEAHNYYDLVQNEGFRTVLKDNWNSWPAKIEYQLESGRLLMTFGYFLLGFYAGCTRLFTAIEKNIPKFEKWNTSTEKAVLFLLFIGMLMYLLDFVTIPGIKVIPELKWIASFLFSTYNACLTIFYITGIILLYRSNYFQKLLKPLGAMGRMALTNYLLQTVFGLLLFYEFGLDLFDKTTPAVNVILAIGIFFLQLKFSQYWLNYFKQGPVEWLWKGLTYFRFSSIRKKNAASSES